MLNKILSLIFLLFFLISSALLFPIALIIWIVTVLFDRKLLLLHLFTSFWACLYIWMVPMWSVSIEGRDRIKKERTYVMVSNHQSQLDILTLFGLFTPFKWLSKSWVFRIPFIGWTMMLNRYIKLAGDDRKSILRAFRGAERALSEGNSVFFFPEGTRSETGATGDFKPGAFVLAKRLKLPILPIAISGASKALPKGSLNFNGNHRIKIRVLDELSYNDYAGLSPDEAAEKVRGIIVPHVEENREVINVQS